MRGAAARVGDECGVREELPKPPLRFRRPIGVEDRQSVALLHQIAMGPQERPRGGTLEERSGRGVNRSAQEVIRRGIANIEFDPAVEPACGATLVTTPVVLIRGDGIGREVTQAAQAIVQAAGAHVVGVIPNLKEGHPVASVVFLKGERFTIVQQPLD